MNKAIKYHLTNKELKTLTGVCICLGMFIGMAVMYAVVHLIALASYAVQ